MQMIYKFIREAARARATACNLVGIRQCQH